MNAPDDVMKEGRGDSVLFASVSAAAASTSPCSVADKWLHKLRCACRFQWGLSYFISHVIRLSNPIKPDVAVITIITIIAVEHLLEAHFPWSTVPGMLHMLFDLIS